MGQITDLTLSQKSTFITGGTMTFEMLWHRHRPAHGVVWKEALDVPELPPQQEERKH